jgi:2-keto-4-pentenoate hydratase/2-oxohepta-3-ene-1,7-dioic acid hydratase in catechol pathway
MPHHMNSVKRIILPALAVTLVVFCANCRPLQLATCRPRPADLCCIGLDTHDGELTPLQLRPASIYCLGFTYASHIEEMGFTVQPDKPPPVFKKAPSTLAAPGSATRMPTRETLIAVLERTEPGLGGKIDRDFNQLPPLLDYEGELAFVLLEDIDWGKIENHDYAPRLGYFIANDISARTIAALGEGRPNRYDYWAASKSLPGFLPVGTHMWIPYKHRPDAILCTTIATRVNGELRQQQPTSDLLYTPRQMLRFIYRRYPDDPPRKGDVILTGTPGGTALRVPAWRRFAANLLRLDRFERLSALIRSNTRNNRYLHPGDEVVVSGGIMGAATTRIVH